MSRQNGTVVRETTTIDVTTGEVFQSTQESVLPVEPDYVKLYLADLVVLNDIPKWVSGILHELLKRMNYQNEIVLNAEIKRRIAMELDIVPQTIDNALVIFIKKSVLYRNGKGVYLANPYLFGKGKWSDIRKIRLSISYGINGKEMEGEIKKFENDQGIQDEEIPCVRESAQ